MAIKELLTNYIETVAKIGWAAPVERFVLRNGKVYEPTPRIGRKLEDKQCYANASRWMDLRGSGNDKYTEGIAYKPGLILMQHAWVTIDGKAMDPTWKDEMLAEYIGIEFDEDTVKSEQFRTGYYGLLDSPTGPNFGLMGKIDPELLEIIEKINTEFGMGVPWRKKESRRA